MPVGNKNEKIAGLGTHHIALQTSDFAASLQFYTEVMGMELAAEFEGDGRRIILLDIGDGSHLELFAPKAGTSPGRDAENAVLFHFALATTDIVGALERVRNAGMEITTDLTTVALGPLNVTLAFFTGPGGEVVELFQVNH